MSKDRELSDALIATWPSQHDLDVILKTPVETSKFLYDVRCISYSNPLLHGVPALQNMMQLPPARSHPVLIAQKLLLLGTFIQRFQPCSAKELANLKVRYRSIASCVVDTATRLVNSNDELVQCIEGIECIMLESGYHKNAGNLRRAYLTLRRAIVIAQMMGLHRSVNPSSLKVLEPETCTRIDLHHMWYRLIESDRYLSLILGLPQACSDDSFASQKALERCTSVERMERIHCVVGGCILQRNDTDMHNRPMTQEIDKLLQDASACMPPQWWLLPDLSSNTADQVQETNRLMHQLPHYFLLVQLHLPYLLHSSSDREYDYNKIAVVNASREILLRFVAFHNGPSICLYCRGIDFLAFVGCTVLCLAHMVASRQQDAAAEVCSRSTVFEVLAHQRHSDRGLTERMLEIMQEIARTTNDTIASNIASALQPLLTIAAAATDGTRYTTDSSFTTGGEGLECGGKLSECGNLLCISIPHFGKVNVERVSAFQTISTAQATKGTSETTPEVTVPESLVPCEAVMLPEVERWTSPRRGEQMGRHNNVFSFNSADTQDSQCIAPWPASTEDWALQGVDMAFFGNLFGESTVPDETEDFWMR